ncbi:MAG: hypothetical protein ACE5JR_13295 [Gemmatimonadota bacterium]
MPNTVRRVDYYYCTVPNRAGRGAQVLNAFKDARVNFLAVHAFPDRAQAQIDFFPEKPKAFLKAAKEAGIKVSPRRTAFLVQGRDRVGVVAEVLEKLGNAKVNVTALDAVSTGGKFGALLWVKRQNVNKAARVLGAKRK